MAVEEFDCKLYCNQKTVGDAAGNSHSPANPGGIGLRLGDVGIPQCGIRGTIRILFDANLLL